MKYNQENKIILKRTYTKRFEEILIKVVALIVLKMKDNLFKL